MTAILVLLDAHVALDVMLAVDPSEYFPVAVNCLVPPTLLIVDPVGDNDMLTSVTAVTVSVSLGLVMDPTFAVIFVVPIPSVLAKPLELIVATPVLLDAHVTPDESVAVEPSVYVPVAVNCFVSPLATLGLAGVTAMLTSALAATVNTSAGLVTDPTFAVMFVVPVATVLAKPLELIVALLVLLDAHVTPDERVAVVLSE